MTLPGDALTFADDLTNVSITVFESGTDTTIPCRVHLYDQTGKPQQAGSLPFWRDHFVCPGTAELKLASGDYRYEIERGPEYGRESGKFSVRGTEPLKIHATLRRIVDIAREGWWSGELHVHRPIADIELLMRAEDLHVAPVITWWHNRRGTRSEWTGGKKWPKNLLVRFDSDRYYHVLAGEDEREGGALLYFNLPEPLAAERVTSEYPSPLKFVADARRRPGAWIDIEKPFWWDTPIWLASGQIDSIGLANNHMCRSEMRDTEAWGKPRDVTQLPSPHGNALWTQEIYYHLLNCGLRVPPSAGSASGVLPNPVGYNRMYAHIDGEFTYEKWWQSLRAGQVFVTNGPLLRVRANGQWPGHVFTAPAAKSIDIAIQAVLDSREPVRGVEIIKNGRVERTLSVQDLKNAATPPTIHFDGSGWFLVRAIVDDPRIFRFASTGPYYIEIGEQPCRVSKSSAQFFLDWVQERTQRVKIDDPAELREVLQPHAKAREFWQGMVAKANTE